MLGCRNGELKQGPLGNAEGTSGYFLSTYDETNHQSDCWAPQHRNVLLLQLLRASLQASHAKVAVTQEVLHFLPQDVELQQARCHLGLQQAPPSHAHRFRVESRVLQGELHRLQPGLQAAQGPQHFHNLGEVDGDWP